MGKTPDFLTHGDGYVDVALSRSFEIAGANVTSVRMREPTVADQLAGDAAKGSDAAKEIAIMANLCELPPEDIKRMPLRDYKRLQVAFMGFID